ncbi:MAG: ABC transporter ATP-binding protein [Microthrixaceae bacterium]
MGDDMHDRIASSAERFGITAALGDLVGGYSTGMKTRLALARSILHDPELLLFDEPTSGLDPESSAAVLSYIREMTDDGRTVVMCTHLLSEAEGLADHVVIMEGGTDLISGSPAELTRRWWPNPGLSIAAEDPRLLERMRGWEGVVSMRNGPGGARLEVDDLARVPDLVEALVRDGVRLTQVLPHQPTLEDLYFLIRGRLSGAAREAGLEVAGVLDPVAAPTSRPVAPPTGSMPTITVPDDPGPGAPGASPDVPGTTAQERP